MMMDNHELEEKLKLFVEAEKGGVKEEEEVTDEMIDAKLQEIQEKLVKGEFNHNLPWVMKQMEAALAICMEGKTAGKATVQDGGGLEVEKTFYIEVEPSKESGLTETFWYELKESENIDALKKQISENSKMEKKVSVDELRLVFRSKTLYEADMGELIQAAKEEQTVRLKMTLQLDGGGKRVQTRSPRGGGDEPDGRLDKQGKASAAQQIIDDNILRLKGAPNVIGELHGIAIQKAQEGMDILARFGQLDVDTLTQLQQIGGTTRLESAKMLTIENAIYKAELGQFDAAMKQLSYCQDIFAAKTKMAVLEKYAGTNGRISWEALSADATRIKDAKLTEQGAYTDYYGNDIHPKIINYCPQNNQLSPPK